MKVHSLQTHIILLDFLTISYPLTLPKANPRIRYRWKINANTNTGSSTKEPVAAMRPHRIALVVMKLVIITGNVRAPLPVRMTA